MPNLTLLRPLSAVGSVVFDVELSERQGDTRDVTQRRIPQGGSISDHSILNPGGKRWGLTGRISNIPQPQSIGRSPNTVLSDLEAFVQDFAAGLVGQSTRLADAIDAMASQIAVGEEVTVVSKKAGKFQAIILSWDVQDGERDHFASTINVELLQVSRAGGLFFTSPNEEGLALNGTGQTNDMGPTSTLTETVEFTP